MADSVHDASQAVGAAMRALIDEYRGQLLEARGTALALARQLREVVAENVGLVKELEAMRIELSRRHDRIAELEWKEVQRERPDDAG